MNNPTQKHLFLLFTACLPETPVWQGIIFRRFLLAFILTFGSLLTFVELNGQCTTSTVTFDEDDFAPGDICASEGMPNPAPVMSNVIDIWDLSSGAPGMDGTGDVQLTYQAVVSNPNANGTCDDGDFEISAAWGGSNLSCGPASSSDFGGSTSDDCVCENGYIIMTVDFVGGFYSTVAGFDLSWSSINGGSEGYEYGFGFVSAGTDASGAALTGLNTAAMLSNL